MNPAYISYSNSVVGDVFGHLGKLATIWFENLIIETPRRADLSNIFDMLVSDGKVAKHAADELLQIWHPVQRHLPDFHFDFDPHQKNEVFDIGAQVAVERLNREYPAADRFEILREAGWIALGLQQTLKAWSQINDQTPCILIPTEYEAETAVRVFPPNQKSDDFEVFSRTVESQVPNLENVSWDKIVELHYHEYLPAFRKKILYVQELIRTGDNRAAGEIISELERGDLLSFFRGNFPDLPVSISKFIASNLPIPLIVNPASIAIGAADLKKQYSNSSRYGWLWFWHGLTAPKQ